MGKKILKKKQGFRFVLEVKEEDLILPWSHIKAKVWKTFRAQVDGLRPKIEKVHLEDGEREYKFECHS